MMHWLLRAARWARNPPSPRTVKFIFALIAILLLLATAESLGLWPDSLTLERQPRPGAPLLR
ncbi:hypothetical protein KHP62_03505 [Rhodobacteraceae bacterium NNCM2]|nr:hypothetical protein [Coraliihabitans acroporae]